MASKLRQLSHYYKILQYNVMGVNISTYTAAAGKRGQDISIPVFNMIMQDITLPVDIARH